MTPRMIGTTEASVLAYMQAQHPLISILMSGQSIPSKSSLYVRFYVIPSGETVPVGLGKNAKARNVGIIQIDVRGPTDKGAGPTGDIAWDLAKFLSRKDITVVGEGLITLKDGTVVDMGERGEEHWQVTRVPYRYDFTL